jgi:MoaA/NifB/PqqE/SkfB family radical SAM enzyme
MADWIFNIDIVGGCNLRCPSCPVGNSDYSAVPKGYMKPELLDQIIAKAVKECGWASIGFYNWSEPLLHPQLPSMIEIVNSYRLDCGVSTNLNILRNADELLAAHPRYICVSVSGINQSNYGITHERGNIEVVKENMAELARAKKRTRSPTSLKISFHRYLGNHSDEQAMREYTAALGFGFDAYWAYMMPAEKNIEFAEPGAGGVKLTDKDYKVIAKLALPLDSALEAAKKHRAKPCILREHRMAITVNGDVMLCCSVYDQSRFKLCNYLEMPLSEIQKIKHRHEFCGPCMKNGVHVLGVYGAPEMDMIALANVREKFPDANLEPMRKTGKKRSAIRRATDQVRDTLRRARPSVTRLQKQLKGAVSPRS